VNFRYAPGRTPQEAEARLAELCAGHGELRIDANAAWTVDEAEAALAVLGRYRDNRFYL